MKILVIMKLIDQTVKYHIFPLTQLKEIEEVFIVRDVPGPEMPKVSYFSPPKFALKLPIFNVLYKLILLFYLSVVKNPDVIWSYFLYPHGIIAFISAKLTGKPVGISIIAGKSEPYILKNPYNLPYPKEIFIKMLKYCDLVTTMGPITKRFLVEKGLDEDKVYVLPPIADKTMCYPTSIPKEYDVISVGRLVSIKHIEILLRAVAKVKKVHEDIKVGIVGDGPDRTRLEKLSLELDISNNVEFLGFRDNVEYYYNASRIFVLTSKREGGPYTVVEAMMCGIPCIVSNAGDIVHIALDGFNSIVIDDYMDVDGFATAIIRLLDDKELYDKLSTNALLVRKTHSVENMVDIWRVLVNSSNLNFTKP